MIQSKEDGVDWLVGPWEGGEKKGHLSYDTGYIISLGVNDGEGGSFVSCPVAVCPGQFLWTLVSCILSWPAASQLQGA